MTRHHDRDLTTASLICSHLAALLPDVRAHVADEYSQVDGFPTSSGDRVKVSASAELTVVEAQANQRLQLALDLADIEAGVRLILVTAADVQRQAQRVLGIRLAREEVRQCRDHQVGKAGVHEWGDANCPRPADKSGLCQAHYMAWYRWRREHGIDTRGDHEPGA